MGLIPRTGVAVVVEEVVGVCNELAERDVDVRLEERDELEIELAEAVPVEDNAVFELEELEPETKLEDELCVIRGDEFEVNVGLDGSEEAEGLVEVEELGEAEETEETEELSELGKAVAELEDEGPSVLLVEDDAVVNTEVEELAYELVVDVVLEMVTDIVAALKLYKFITQLLPHISEEFPRHGKLH